MDSSSCSEPPAQPALGHQTTESPLSTDALFEKLKLYDFGEDREFAKGLSIILGHPDVPPTETEIHREDDLVLQAKCFYFSRKEKLTEPLNFATYKAWLALTLSTNQPSFLNESAGNTLQQPDASPSPEQKNEATSVQEPVYPSSFAHIVELITTGQPIPGIQQIPDTVLTGRDTLSTEPKRRKPWEKERADEASQA